MTATTVLVELPESHGAWVNPAYITAIVPGWEHDGVSGASWVDVYVLNRASVLMCMYADVRDEDREVTRHAAFSKRDAVLAAIEAALVTTT